MSKPTTEELLKLELTTVEILELLISSLEQNNYGSALSLAKDQIKIHRELDKLPPMIRYQ